MLCAGPPDKSVLEGLLKSAVDLVTYVLYGRVIADDECFVEVGLDPLPGWGFNEISLSSNKTLERK